jgi:hypothetical protein
MSSAGTITAEDRRKIQKLIAKHRGHTNDGGGARGRAMTEDECERVRRLVAEGERPADIARRDDVEFARDTLGKHIRGNCAHEVSGDARKERGSDD